MTEEEAWALDELVTNTRITIGPNGTDFLSLREARILGMDDLSVNYLTARAEATHQSIGHVIGELVRKEIAATSV
jgi:hypothetical protein